MRYPSAADCSRVSIVTAPASASGVSFTLAIAWAGSGSSHTVCQMPVVGVYQMLRGFNTCLPRGCGPASDGSHTDTTSSWSPPFTRASVMSNANGS